MGTSIYREAWLQKAVKALAPIFAEQGITLPAKVQVSVGWPGGRGNKNAVIGQCWNTKAAGDNVNHLFISPRLEDPTQILAVLAHELIHAVDDCRNAHKGPFRKMALAIGLQGKMTATVAGEALQARLEAIAETLGDYPHKALVSMDGITKQTTRMLKVECPEGSGYIVRMTRKWLDELGTPSCPCHAEPMIEA